QAYKKVPQPASGFAVVGVAVSLTRNAKGASETAGIGITGVAAKAYRPAAAEKALVGSALDEPAIAAAAAPAVGRVGAGGHQHASAAYRRRLAEVYTARAAAEAAARAK